MDVSILHSKKTRDIRDFGGADMDVRNPPKLRFRTSMSEFCTPEKLGTPRDSATSREDHLAQKNERRCCATRVGMSCHFPVYASPMALSLAHPLNSPIIPVLLARFVFAHLHRPQTHPRLSSHPWSLAWPHPPPCTREHAQVCVHTHMPTIWTPISCQTQTSHIDTSHITSTRVLSPTPLFDVHKRHREC